MWLKPKDYFDFAKECGIVYFQVDLAKLLDEIYDDTQVLPGITLDELNEKCLSYYNDLITSCPEGMPFEQYIAQELYEDFALLRKVLLKIHKYFLDD